MDWTKKELKILKRNYAHEVKEVLIGKLQEFDKDIEWKEINEEAKKLGLKRNYSEEYLLRKQCALMKKFCRILKVKTPIKLKIAKWWLLLTSPDKKEFLLHVPYYLKNYETFIAHYACHAKINETNWINLHFKDPALVIVDKEKILKDANITKEELDKRCKEKKPSPPIRSYDAFNDFFVWLLVAEKLGRKYFINHDKGMEFKEFVKRWKESYKKIGYKFHNFLNAVDWFVVSYLVAEKVDRKIFQNLDKIYNKILENKKARNLLPEDAAEKIEKLRQLFIALEKEFPVSQLESWSREKLKQKFNEYYSIIYHDTGAVPKYWLE